MLNCIPTKSMKAREILIKYDGQEMCFSLFVFLLEYRDT